MPYQHHYPLPDQQRVFLVFPHFAPAATKFQTKFSKLIRCLFRMQNRKYAAPAMFLRQSPPLSNLVNVTTNNRLPERSQWYCCQTVAGLYPTRYQIRWGYVGIGIEDNFFHQLPHYHVFLMMAGHFATPVAPKGCWSSPFSKPRHDWRRRDTCLVPVAWEISWRRGRWPVIAVMWNVKWSNAIFPSWHCSSNIWMYWLVDGIQQIVPAESTRPHFPDFVWVWQFQALQIWWT